MTPSRQTARRQLLELFEEHGDDAPLDRAVALLAADEQAGVAAEVIIESLDRLGSGLWLAPSDPPYAQLARLHHYLFTECGFEGDRETYDEPSNSYLDYVLEWRRGLPISLAVVYIEVARRAGLQVHGIGFPGHFLVQPILEGQSFFVDPFAGGTIRQESTLRGHLNRMGVAPSAHDLCLQPVSTRAILVRMSLNLRGSWTRRGELDAAVWNGQRAALLDPAQR